MSQTEQGNEAYQGAGARSSHGLTRREFLGVGAGVVGGTLLASRGLGQRPAARRSFAGTQKTVIEFWDMAWGTTSAYNAEAGKIVKAWKRDGDSVVATYEEIPWANYVETFESAIAARKAPAVSSGGGYQALAFYTQGAIAPADNVIAKLRTEDFYPNTINPLQYHGHYYAVPWELDVRVLYYRKSLLEKAGVAVPTDWDSLKAACIALKKIGVSGFGIAAGGGTSLGAQQLFAMIYNNNGGMYDEAGNPDCVTDRNIETLEFLAELRSIGAIKKEYISYTTNDLGSAWGSGTVGMGFEGVNFWDALTPSSAGRDVLVASPLTGPHGDKGTVFWVNNLMMYADTPSIADSEAFLEYYLDNMKVYWEKNLIAAVPVRKSIAQLPQVRGNARLAKITAEWVPVGRTEAYKHSRLLPVLNAVDGGAAQAAFVDQVIGGGYSPKEMLQGLQKGIESVEAHS